MTLLVPYRDREEHLKEFVPSINEYLKDSTAYLNIVIVEQFDDKPFNRGKLINVGFLESRNEIKLQLWVHDVDMIPIDVDYFPFSLPVMPVIQLAKSDIQKTDYLGGVTLFSSIWFNQLGGYHNDYFHRAEDNEMWFHLKRNRLRVLHKVGSFRELPHERPKVEFDPVLWQKAQLPRTKDMLKTCEYKLISKELKDGYTHLKVEL